MVSLGEELKRERELREITLREISDATKISVRILEAIESNNYKLLPGGIFNRNFLRAYADFIGIDPENVVRKYEQQYDGKEEEDLPIPNIILGMQKEPSPPRNHTRILILVAAVLLIAAAGLYLFFNRSRFFSQGVPQKPVSRLHHPVMILPEEGVWGQS